MNQIDRRQRRFEKGFTLIEVVIALAILGIGLTVIIELFSGGLRLARISEEYTRGANYARIKMGEIASQQGIKEGDEEGKFDETYRWEVGVKKIDILPIEKTIEFKPPVEFYQIKVTILWKSGSKERSMSAESYKTVKPEADEKKS